ncbi:probable sodium/potassium/calcium exchanger CG1090 isoform X1 [Tribolium castaneum]|uniref:probable sodium/potassium/calcium exchanger CG1090 isoform X1 n=1 Tax=Tribolium castaneum TaxID=7070 RepID=UPI0030FE4C90
MRRTRRHKFLQISVFFLIYSIIHVLSENSTQTNEKNATETTSETPTTVTKVVTSPLETTPKTTTSKVLLLAKKRNASGTADCTPPAIQQNMIRSRRHTRQRRLIDWTHHLLLPNKTKTTTPTTRKTTTKPKTTTHKPAQIAHKELKHNETKISENTNQTTTPSNETESVINETFCIPPAVQQFPRPLIGPTSRKHGGIIVHIIVAVYTFLGLAIVCDEYFVASLDRICEELKMSPDVAGATFMAAGSSAPELATVIIGVFFAKDDIGISGVIGSAVFNIMFVISVCALCTTTVIYLNWWPLIRDCFFYAVSILVMLVTIQDKMISWIESLFMILMYVVYCVALHYNSYLEQWAQKLPVPCKKVAPDEQSGLVSYKTLEEERKHPSYGCSPEKPSQESFEQGFDNQLSGPALNQASGGAAPAPAPVPRDYYRPKEYDPANTVDPLVKPTEGGLYKQITWGIVFPIHYLCRKTMPDCRSEQYKNWYPFTFFMSMLWISFYSYFMVWMITIIGTTLGIPDTVMGLTFVAAGVSVPDALSSIAVIKEGYGDMAVSNAVGSNVFDILICLGLPWFIKTAIIKPGSDVPVISKGLTYSTLSLLSTVVFLVAATHLNGWKLDRKYGIILMAWYLIFITFASMYELNVFGYLNPPECSSDY